MNNRFGLNRSIPDPIKRIIRQNSGYGCVICGLAIAQYEHVKPEFKDARVHDPSKMTLLCPNCHHKVTVGYTSKDFVLECMENPRPFVKGYAYDFINLYKGFPELKISGSIIKNCPIPIQIRNVPIIRFEKDYESNQYLISAVFFDSKGAKSLEIHRNEWYASTNNWDVELVGTLIIIRERKGKIHLLLSMRQPNIMEISRIDINFQNYRILGNSDNIAIYYNQNKIVDIKRLLSDNCGVGLNLN